MWSTMWSVCYCVWAGRGGADDRKKLKIAIVHECSVRIPFHLTADTPSPVFRWILPWMLPSGSAQIRSESDRAATADTASRSPHIPST